jgi:hypothetical protein
MKPSALLLVVAIVVVPGAPVFAREQHSATKSKSLASTPMEKSKSLGYASEEQPRLANYASNCVRRLHAQIRPTAVVANCR